MGVHSEIVAGDLADGAIIKKRTDKEVVACIRERGVEGPVSKGMISAMRSRLEGEDFNSALAAIANDPVKLDKFLAECRRAGLEDFAEAVENRYGPGSEVPIEPHPKRDALAELASRSGETRTWGDVLDAYRKSVQADVEFHSADTESSKDAEQRFEAIADARSAAFVTVMMYPAPSLEALATKLAIYAGEDGHEFSDAPVFQAQLSADAARIAHKLSGARDPLAFITALIARVERSMQRGRECGDSDLDIYKIEQGVLSILKSATGDISREQDRQDPIAPATNDPDTKLYTAWNDLLRLLATEPQDGFTEEGALWERNLEKAEEVLCQSKASSVSGVIAQLWCGISHSLTSESPAWLQEAMKAGDFETILARRADLSFDQRMVVQAIDGLMSMETAMLGGAVDA